MNRRLLKSNDDEIFKLTGCLSKCDYYMYDSEPLSRLTNYPTFEANLNNTMLINLWFPTGRHQVLEQVEHV